MAQRTVHYLLGEILIREGVGDIDRFRVGNLLPDAYTGYENRFRTHFVKDIQTEAGRVAFCDLESFYDRFRDRMQTDSLYLGYYMHLVEDACYRVFWRSLGLQGKIRTSDDIRKLHRDYRILNGYIVEHYGLNCEARMPERFEYEPINSIYPFEAGRLLADLENDFKDRPQGKTSLLREEGLDAFIDTYTDKCREVLRQVKTTGRSVPSQFLTWPKVNYQFNK